MKIPEIKIEIEKSENFSEEKFSIGNVGFILNILRDKLYSNIIESACREYASNSRDAHREIGTPNRPIEIYFPNAFNSNFSVKDFGIGISPKRMTEVFLQYGNSTKRNDNSQLGGFGLGAKLFMGYSNQFSIITTSKEIKNNKEINVKRTYILYIDSSQEGRLNLVKEEITNEPTGTEVICAIKDEDIQAFIDGTIKSTQYWPVRPLLFGTTTPIEYPQTVGDLIAESSNWKIYNKKKINNYNDTARPESLAIIDGIQYKINESFISREDRWILSCNVHMFFDIGQLTLSASRETLQYDENTKKIINDRIKLVQKELSEQIIDILDKKDSYVEAVEFFNFMNLYFNKALNNRNLTWRGNKIIGSEVPVSKTVLESIKAKITTYISSEKNGKTSIRSFDSKKIALSKHNEIYYNDLDPEHTYRSKLLKALESHNNIQLISYVKDKSYDDFVNEFKSKSVIYFNNLSSGTAINYYKEENNSFILDIIKPKLLSSLVGVKIPKSTRVVKPVAVNKIKAHRLSQSTSWKLRDHFYKVELDKEVEGCYIITTFNKDECYSVYKNGTLSFAASEMSDIKKFLPNIEIYAVKEKDLPKVPKLRPLSEVLEENFKKLNEDYYKSVAINKLINDYGKRHYSTFINLNGLEVIMPLKNKIKNQNNLILKYFDLIKFENSGISYKFLSKIESFLNLKNNIDKHIEYVDNLLTEIKSRYKLLSHLTSSVKPQDVINYINMCDELNKQNKNKIAIGA